MAMSVTLNSNKECQSLNHSIIIQPQMLASAYVPFQISEFTDVYEPDEALNKGTLFPELYLPCLGYPQEATYER